MAALAAARIAHVANLKLVSEYTAKLKEARAAVKVSGDVLGREKESMRRPSSRSRWCR